jgi:poly-beta-1,6-N-acetyl-D-glucosamine synthase
MAKAIRVTFLLAALFYLSLCVAGGVESSRMLHRWLIIFFMLFGVVVVVRYLVLLGAAICEKRRKESCQNYLWTPFVSIVVPAFNEERLIESALTSLTKLDYPDYEIIVVDDGSSDGTARIARQVADRNPQMKFRVISQSNSGKSWALNTGILHAMGEIVLCVDADSVLDQGALRAGIHHFDDHRVGAVGGFVDVINKHKLITRLQQLEYVIGINFLRRGMSHFGVVTVVPGPIGMFRADAIRQVSGYNTSGRCFAEDADLTMRLLVNGWRVKGETRMIARTEVPDSIYSLLRQRYRWKRGLFQAWFDNVYHLLSSGRKGCTLIAAILMFESFVFDISSFGITLFGIASFLAFGEFKVFLLGFAILTALDLIIFVFANLEQGRPFERFGLFIVSKISYAYLLQAWGVFSLFDEWRDEKMSWDKLERIGNASLKSES